MIKLVAKQKIGFRNPETQEIVTAEPYVFSTLPDWVEKDPMYGWALADGTLEAAGAEKEARAPKYAKKEGGAAPPQEGDKKE